VLRNRPSLLVRARAATQADREEETEQPKTGPRAWTRGTAHPTVATDAALRCERGDAATRARPSAGATVADHSSAGIPTGIDANDDATRVETAARLRHAAHHRR
jgi:hypothetical protein